MNAEETAQVLNEFASSFAGTSYDDLRQYETDALLREITGSSGATYQLFLGTEFIETFSADSPESKWICRLSVSAAPIASGRPDKRSIIGFKDVLPGRAWSGDLENIGLSTLPSTAGCYIALVLSGLILVGLIYWIQAYVIR